MTMPRPSHPSPNGDVFVVSAARTPIGKFGGGLATTPATVLGGIAIRAARSSRPAPAKPRLGKRPSPPASPRRRARRPSTASAVRG